MKTSRSPSPEYIPSSPKPIFASPQSTPSSPPLSPPSPEWTPISPQPISVSLQPVSALPQPTPSGSKKKKRKAAATSTGKRQPWTIADNELLTKGFLYVTSNRIVENAQRSSDFWKRVLEYYTERESSGAVRSSHNLRSHWHMIKNNVTAFNNIVLQLRADKGSGWSEDQLKTHAHTKYFEEHNTHFIHEHVWNLVKNEPKWKKQTEIQETKTIKTSASSEDTTSLNANTFINLNDGVDNTPISVEDYEVDELPRPTKAAKSKRSTKGKGIEDVTTKLDDMFHKKVDMIEQFNAKMTQLLELKEKKLDMEILYKDRSQMDPETLAFHKEHCAMIREKYAVKK